METGLKREEEKVRLGTRLVGWLVGCLFGWLVDWLVGWLRVCGVRHPESQLSPSDIIVVLRDWKKEIGRERLGRESCS